MTKNKPTTKEHIFSIFSLIILGISAVLFFQAYSITINAKFDSLNSYTSSNNFCIATEKYENKNLNYFLNYPSGWQVVETEKQTTIASDSTSILITTHNSNDLSLLSWIDNKIKTDGKISLIEDNPLKIADVNGMYLRIKENETQESMQIYFSNDNLIYELKLIYPANSDFSYYKSIFNKAASSFSF